MDKTFIRSLLIASIILNIFFVFFLFLYQGKISEQQKLIESYRIQNQLLCEQTNSVIRFSWNLQDTLNKFLVLHDEEAITDRLNEINCEGLLNSNI